MIYYTIKKLNLLFRNIIMLWLYYTIKFLRKYNDKFLPQLSCNYFIIYYSLILICKLLLKPK